MKLKIFFWIILVLLVGSIAANGILAYLMTDTQSQLEQVKAQASADVTDYEAQISTLSTQNEETNADLATAQAEINRLRGELGRANSMLDTLLCESDDLNMDYSNNSAVALRLQAYVSTLEDVRSVSYVIPERLYSNTLSQLYHVTYVSEEDGQVYSQRYIVYVDEFSYEPGTFDLSNQCWIDAP